MIAYIGYILLFRREEKRLKISITEQRGELWMKEKNTYHGWVIELIPLSKGYAFKCWMPDEQIGISNNHIYPGTHQAIRAARKRVKLESASLALIRFLNESYKNCHLSPKEYLALASSISDFITSASKPKT
ncbi:hypothetical protein [Cylindrospermum stagnale]|nr:hypothetical protein [Cylindrospermum stagnale]